MKNNMKKYPLFLLVFISCLTFNGFAQNKNAIKVNLPALVIRNISVQYERQISPKSSVAIAFRTLPYGKLPFANTIADIVDNSYVQFDKMNVGSFGVTPEIRFYLSKKGAMRGFYLAPFANFSTYKSDLPIEFNNRTGSFNGKVSTITGGLQLGSQFRLSNSLSLDWWIIGPNYGGASGDMNFIGALSSSEQAELRTRLEEIKQDAPLNIIESYTVTGNGASIQVKGPWAGVRGGLNLAFHF